MPALPMANSKSRVWMVAAWVAFVGGYAVVSLVAVTGAWPSLAPGSAGLTLFGNMVQCVVPLLANAGLMLNAASPYRRWNLFWMLLALGCTLWLAAQLMWTYTEMVAGRSTNTPFVSDILFFLPTVPMIGALALQPHARKLGEALRYGYFDLFLLGVWWVYLYVFFVMPWKVVVFDMPMYLDRYLKLFAVESAVFLAVLALICWRTKGEWRRVYLHLLGAGALYSAGSLAITVAMKNGTYYTGSLADLPLVASFVWFGTAGVLARWSFPAPPEDEGRSHSMEFWPTRLAMGCVLSMPLLAAWSLYVSHAPQEITDFRVFMTLAAFALGAALVFFRQHLVDRERLRLLRASQDAIDNLKRLQSQFVQSEKLAALGQLAAGAAHEINNPLTAILGYSELLIDDATLAPRQRTLVEKLREQARRTTSLVNNLLSFARQVPVEKALLDVNGIVTSALQLRKLDLRDKNIGIEVQTESVVPGVRGDPNQLLQVFFNIISNAVDAMQEVNGGTLSVRTFRDRGNVVIEFADTGPGIREPHLVFDPFYTTKPVGKGTGLGLSICYGIVQEHNGRISCFNRPEGGATFRVELPAVLAVLPQSLAATGKS
jgi:signal transduction histidine kinase